MRRRRWIGVAALVIGCGGDPAPVPAPRPEPEAQEVTQELPSPQVAELLPTDPERVSWFVARRPGDAPRRIALFTTFDDQLHLPVLGSLGWSHGEAEVRLRAGARAIWFWPAGLAQTAYRVWTPDRTWDEGRGRRYGPERVDVPCGRFEAVRTERLGGALEVVHWLAPDHGLVRLRVQRAGEVVLELELTDEAEARRAPSGSRATPRATWAAIEGALRHLDGRALDACVTPELMRRLDGPRDAVQPLLGESLGHSRLEALLELGAEPEPGQPPAPDEDTARVRASSRQGPVWLVFTRDARGWRWSDWEAAAE
ncbi:MAG: hypothetical protein R3F62_04335 [Planctomycetota bacterium]